MNTNLNLKSIKQSLLSNKQNLITPSITPLKTAGKAIEMKTQQTVKVSSELSRNKNIINMNTEQLMNTDIPTLIGDLYNMYNLSNIIIVNFNDEMFNQFFDILKEMINDLNETLFRDYKNKSIDTNRDYIIELEKQNKILDNKNKIFNIISGIRDYLNEEQEIINNNDILIPDIENIFKFPVKTKFIENFYQNLKSSTKTNYELFFQILRNIIVIYEDVLKDFGKIYSKLIETCKLIEFQNLPSIYNIPFTLSPEAEEQLQTNWY